MTTCNIRGALSKFLTFSQVIALVFRLQFYFISALFPDRAGGGSCFFSLKAPINSLLTCCLHSAKQQTDNVSNYLVNVVKHLGTS